jgi:hypothetical protein
VLRSSHSNRSIRRRRNGPFICYDRQIFWEEISELTIGRKQFHSFQTFERVASFERSAASRSAVFYEQLHRRKMENLIRVVRSANKEALEAYHDEVFKKLGCRRVRYDKLHKK